MTKFINFSGKYRPKPPLFSAFSRKNTNGTGFFTTRDVTTNGTVFQKMSVLPEMTKLTKSPYWAGEGCQNDTFQLNPGFVINGVLPQTGCLPPTGCSPPPGCISHWVHYFPTGPVLSPLWPLFPTGPVITPPGLVFSQKECFQPKGLVFQPKGRF